MHENLSIVMSHAYSLKPLSEMMAREFYGPHRFLEKGLFHYANQRAEKALMELALFLRTVDDEEGISSSLEGRKIDTSCGRLTLESGAVEPLPFRELTNKVIHARHLEWRMTIVDHGSTIGPADAPTLYVHPRKHPQWLSAAKRWTVAEVDLVHLAGICSMIAH